MTDLPAGVAWLFCPADRPERFARAAAAADVTILDLEDGVAPADRPAARAAVVDADLDPAVTIIRINPVGTADHELDLAMLAGTTFTTVMLAKTESAEQVDGLDRFGVVGLCETPRGVLAASAIAARPNALALMWGAEDLVAALGGQSSRRSDGTYRDVARAARSAVLLGAGAAGVVAVDAVYLDIADTEGLAVEADDACASGFAVKACIHPSQVDVVRAAYRPDAGELDWARRVLAAAGTERGVFRFDGRMVDEPILQHARAVISRAQ